ncbi:MAG: hypothetical protein AAGE92_12555 [Cyanobacteria bacterium P01_G01_bin.4]
MSSKDSLRIRELKRRIEILERTIICTIFVFVLLFLSQQVSPIHASDENFVAQTITANSIYIEDREGNTRFALESTDEGEIYSHFMDTEGNSKIFFSDSPSATGLGIYDKNEVPRFYFGIDATASTYRLTASSGASINQFIEGDRLETKIIDTSGKTRIGEYVSTDEALFWINDSSENPRIFNLVDSTISTTQSWDKNGKVRHIIGINKDNESLEQMYDQLGDVKTSTYVSEDGQLSYFVEPTASENVIRTADWLLRLKGLFELLN